MRSNFKIIRENSKYLLETYRFRLIILFLICFNIYGTGYLTTNETYIDGILVILTNGYYIVSMLAMFLINTINTIDMYENNIFYIIRFKNRKEYLLQLIKNVIISNLILFFINILVLLIGMNVFVNNFVLENILDYSIPNIVYLIFYLLRMMVLIQMISVISLLIIKLFNVKISIVANIIIWLFIMVSPYNMGAVVNSILDMHIFISDYFRLHLYSGFILEVLCSTIYITILLIISYIMFYITKNKMRQIGGL